MAGTVKLMAFLQILPFMIRLLNDEIGIQISILLLRLSDEIDHLIGPAHQFRIRPYREGIGHPLQPLGHIAVLKDKSVKLSFFQSRRDSVIQDRMAFFRSFYFIMKNSLLIGNHFVYDQVLHLRPERILDPDITYADLPWIFVLHNTPSLLSEKRTQRLTRQTIRIIINQTCDYCNDVQEQTRQVLFFFHIHFPQQDNGKKKGDHIKPQVQKCKHALGPSVLAINNLSGPGCDIRNFGHRLRITRYT